MVKTMEAINHQLFLHINGLAGNPFFDALNCFIAAGSPYFYAAILVAVYLGGKRDRALYAFYTAVAGLLINFLITAFYFHPRPFMIGLGRVLMHHGPETSFPSDHATLAFCVAFSFWLDRGYKTGTGLLVLALLTGFARVYTGLHFPLDIAGSVGVALVASLIITGLKKSLAGFNLVINRLYDNLLPARFKPKP